MHRPHDLFPSTFFVLFLFRRPRATKCFSNNSNNEWIASIVCVFNLFVSFSRLSLAGWRLDEREAGAGAVHDFKSIYE